MTQRPIEDIYCFLSYPDHGLGYCMDRTYTVIDAPWHKVPAHHIIEKDNKFAPSFQHPDWAVELDNAGARHYAYWTDYYENR